MNGSGKMSDVVLFVGTDVDEDNLRGVLLELSFELSIEFGCGEARKVGGEESMGYERKGSVCENCGEDYDRDEGGNKEKRVRFHDVFYEDFGTLQCELGEFFGDDNWVTTLFGFMNLL